MTAAATPTDAHPPALATSPNAVNLLAHQDRLRPHDSMTWAELGLQLQLDWIDDAAPVPISSPTISRLPSNDMKIYGGDPLTEDVVLVRCNHCKRRLLMSSFADHADRCPNGPKPVPESDVACPVEIETPVVVPTSGPFRGLTLKRSVRYKDATTATIDLDRHCGVRTPCGLPCLRPLTCRVHSMLAKSMVQGRSRPLPHLLRAATEGVVINECGPEIDADLEALLDVLERPVKPIATAQFTDAKRFVQSRRLREYFVAILHHPSSSMVSPALTRAVTPPAVDPIALGAAATTAEEPKDKDVTRGRQRKKKPVGDGEKAPKKRQKKAAAGAQQQLMEPIVVIDQPGTIDPRDLKFI